MVRTSHPTVQPASAATAKAPAGDVLIVDDNQAVAKALAALIVKAGFAAVSYHSGTDALAYADASTPVAAVLDIHLPDLNGLVLARKLRDRFGDAVPIIIVSGDTSMETIKTLPHVGATYFFPKPLNPAALVTRLREILSG